MTKSIPVPQNSVPQTQKEFERFSAVNGFLKIINLLRYLKIFKSLLGTAILKIYTRSSKHLKQVIDPKVQLDTEKRKEKSCGDGAAWSHHF